MGYPILSPVPNFCEGWRAGEELIFIFMYLGDITDHIVGVECSCSLVEHFLLKLGFTCSSE